MNNSVACITCFFNFYKCPLQERNLHRFITHLNSLDVPVYGVELVLQDQTPVTTKYSTWKQVVGTSNNILWQKEILLNLAEKLVPEEYDTLAWVDADIKFESNTWVTDLHNQLDFCDFVQLFDRAFWLDVNNKIEHEATTVINHNPEIWEGHPGFAWGCKRETWRKIGGLYERCFSGGGDTVMATIFTNKENIIIRNLNTYIGCNDDPFYEWCRKLKNCIATNITGSVYHEFHGRLGNRQYGSRKRYTPQIDGFKDIIKNKDGILEWAAETPSLFIEHFKQYFQNRVDS